jgi:hypothetical protein
MIRVTQKDIDNGIQSDPYCCPVALAVKRKYPDKCVCVLGSSVFINHKRHSVSHNVWDFEVDFDLGREVKPFRFKLEES